MQTALPACRIHTHWTLQDAPAALLAASFQLSFYCEEEGSYQSLPLQAVMLDRLVSATSAGAGSAGAGLAEAGAAGAGAAAGVGDGSSSNSSGRSKRPTHP